MGKHLTVNDLKYLTTNIIYDNFERGDGNCDEEPFYDEIMSELKLHSNLTPIRDQLAKAVCYVYWRKANHNNFDTDLCTYLYYWLGDKIYPIIKDKAVFSKIIKAIYDELYASYTGAICNHPKYTIDQDTFNKNKLLFDYYKNYEHIDLITISGDTRCDEDYIKFIKRYINTYNDAYEYCTGTRGKNYDCDYFDKLFKQDKYIQLNPFYCMQYDSLTPSTEEKSGLRTRQYRSPGIIDSKMDPALSVSSDPKINHVERGRHRPRGNDGSVVYQPSDEGFIPPMEDTTEGGSSKTIAGSVVPVLGVSSISLLLYKVTPLGGFINKLLGRNSNMYNPIEDIDGFNPYSDGMDPGGRRMNISYHRL